MSSWSSHFSALKQQSQNILAISFFMIRQFSTLDSALGPSLFLESTLVTRIGEKIHVVSAQISMEMVPSIDFYK